MLTRTRTHGDLKPLGREGWREQGKKRGSESKEPTTLAPGLELSLRSLSLPTFAFPWRHGSAHTRSRAQLTMPPRPACRPPSLPTTRLSKPCRPLPPPSAHPPTVATVLATVEALHPAWAARGCRLEGDGPAPTPDTAAAALRAVATVAPRASRGSRTGSDGATSLLRDRRVAGLVGALRLGGEEGQCLSPARALDATIAIGTLATSAAHDAILDGCLARVDACGWEGVSAEGAAEVMGALAAACYAPPSPLTTADARVATGAAFGPRTHARPLTTALWACAVLRRAPAACLDVDNERAAAKTLAAAASRGGLRGARATARALWSLAALQRESGPAFATTLAALAASLPPPDTLDLPTLTQLHLACTAATVTGVALPPRAGDLAAAAAAATVARAGASTQSSALQDSVLATLERLLGKSAVQREGVAPEVGLPVDALLSGTRVAIEVDGVSHSIRVPRASAPTILIPDGRTALKTRLLEGGGWRVLRVTAGEWEGAGASAEREAWLLARLVVVGAVAG